MPTIRFKRGLDLSSVAEALPKLEKIETFSLVDCLLAIQQNKVTILPISPQKGLGILGRGLSGQIQQSSADVVTTFAFKDGIPERLPRDTDDLQDWYSLVTEISILQHPAILKNPHIVDLVGICFSVERSENAPSTGWPMLVMLKANLGDLSTLLFGDGQSISSDQDRIQLFAEVAEAIYLLHTCGVAHGDIKPENILVEKSEEGELNYMLTDFGSSLIQGQKRLPTLSEPWCAPELRSGGDVIDIDGLVEADLFSFGLLSLHLFIPLSELAAAGLCLLRRPDMTEHQWADFINQFKILKAIKGEGSLEMKIRGFIKTANVSENLRTLLEMVVGATLPNPTESRHMPWRELLPYIQHYLSYSFENDQRTRVVVPKPPSLDHAEHAVLNLAAVLGELDDTDYAVRRSLLQDILYKGLHSLCNRCKEDYAFLGAVCCSLGFGALGNPPEAQNWLAKSGKSEKTLVSTIESIGREYRVTGRVAEEVLDQLALRVLVTNDRIQDYQSSGRLSEAEDALRHEIEARARCLGHTHRCLAKLLSELAKVSASRNHLAEAQQYQQQSADILYAHFGDQNPHPLLAKLQLAQILANRMFLQEAEDLFDTTIAKLESVIGSEHPDIASALQNLANLRISVGKYEDAATTMVRVVTMRMEKLSPTHRSTISAELNLAQILRASGKTTDAVNLVEKVAAKVRDAFDDRDLINVYLWFAQAAIYEDTEPLDRVIEKIYEVLKLLERLRLPPEDMLRLSAYEVLVSVCSNRKCYVKLERIVRQCLGQVQTIDKRAPLKSFLKTSLAQSLIDQGRFSEAQIVAQEVLDDQTGDKLQNPRDILGCFSVQARVAAQRGRPEDGLPIRRQCLEFFQRQLGANNYHTLAAQWHLASLLNITGGYEEAERQCKEIIGQLGDQGRVRYWNTLFDLAGVLGNACSHQGRFDEAEEHYNEGIVWSVESVGEAHRKTLSLYNSLASTYIRRRKDYEAEKLIQEKLEEQTKNTELGIHVLKNLARLRWNQDRMVEAAELMDQALNLSVSIFGERHPKTLSAIGKVLALALDRGLGPELEKSALENIEAKREVLGPVHRSTIQTMIDLASAYSRNQCFPEAEALLRTIDDLYDRGAFQDPSERATYLGRAAGIYYQMGKFDEAERREVQALEIQKVFSAPITHMS